MSATITMEEAQAHLKELIENLAPGQELIITEGQRPVAKIVGQGAYGPKLPPLPGNAMAKRVPVHP